MTRLVHEGLNPDWKPSDFNLWLTQRYSKAALIADNLYLSAQGTSVNWLCLAVLGAVRTHYYKMTEADAFYIGHKGSDYEKQADEAPAHWIGRVSVEEVLKEPELLYAYDTVYAASVRFLDGMAARRSGNRVDPLPTPEQHPAPIPPARTQPEPVPDADAQPANPVPPKPTQPGWSGVVIPIVSAIIGLVAGAIGPWGPLLNTVWSVIKSLIGG